MSHHSHADSGHLELGHQLPFSVYLKVFVTLVVLTVITVWVSRYDFGVMNIVVAMVVASIKALVVALFFMHLKYEDKLTWLYAAFPIVLLFTLIGGVFLDNATRYDPKYGGHGKDVMEFNRAQELKDVAQAHGH